MKLFFETIDEFKPDLIGMQEVLPFQAAQIKSHFKGYDFVGVGRDDGKNKGEMAPLLFRRDRFEKLREGVFWLSETPEMPGSKSWDAAITRLVMWTELRDKRAG